jgi:hypothetical protein
MISLTWQGEAMNLMKKVSLGLAVGSFMVMGLASTAFATLTTAYSVSGNVGLSVDGGGSLATSLPDGLNAEIPAGSTVIAAFLYTSTFDIGLGAAGTPFAGGTFNGTAVSYSALIPNASACCSLQAAVADVTGIVQSAVGGVAVGGTYNFAVTESNTEEQDGEVLDVVYSNPSLPVGSIGILNGAAVTTGDSSSINFGSDPSGSTVYMSIGDGFSYDPGVVGPGEQESTITVDGSTLTTAAGNCDLNQDNGPYLNPSACSNGNLITAGVVGLNADGSVDTAFSNPFTPIGDSDVSTDHELYNISSLINPADGDTISLSTFNTSNDDNIFTEAFYVNGLAGFNAPPPPPSGAPEPGTFSLLGLGMSSLGMMYRRLRKAA